MFVFPRLPALRQRNVGEALEAVFRAKTSFTPDVTKRAKAVISATANLGEAAEGEARLFTIDVAIDGVLSAIFRVTQATQKGLTASVVPLNAEQQSVLEAATLIEELWFPSGIGFIRDPAGLQHAAMLGLRNMLSDAKKGPKLKAAFKKLSLTPLVDHFLAHLPLYTKALGLAGEETGDDADAPVDASELWHRAYVKFAVAVEAAYDEDAAARKRLLGPYEKELAAHRADQAKERKRAKAEAAKAKKAPADA